MELSPSTLRNVISDTLARAVKAQNLVAACEELGLRPGDAAEAWQSKHNYIKKRLPHTTEELLDLSRKILRQYPCYRLEEYALRFEDLNGARKTTELTRRNTLRTVIELGPLQGNMGIIEFLKVVWPIDKIPALSVSDTLEDWLRGSSSPPTSFQGTFETDVFQHMVSNPGDWDQEFLLKRLGVLEGSERRFLRFLELLANPMVRQGEVQERWANSINAHIRRDGLELRPTSEASGYPVYRVLPVENGVRGQPKNLIFAANGPKPRLILRDAVNNDIQIVENASFCLVYEPPLPSACLRWKHLVKWWSELTRDRDSDGQADRRLYRRLYASLASRPERLLFKTYFKHFATQLDSVPALIPQVYLHYDPYTARQLGGVERLFRQRMDFLILFSCYERIVIEVDGKQHYADGDIAKPARYSSLVAADRELRLAGYEVYRFGGFELMQQNGEGILVEFFTRLMKKHNAACSATM